MKKGFTILGIILLLSLIITSNASAITGKIGNGKMIITADVGESVSRTIRVINDNDVPLNISLFIILLFIFVFAIDMIVIKRKKIVRLVGHNIDHIVFLGIILIFILLFAQGTIL